jgi:ATP-dependent Clp protease, protease subunit
MRTGFYLIFASLSATLLTGCVAMLQSTGGGNEDSSTAAKVDFSDPVLNRRQILLFGQIDEPAAEKTIQKLLYLDAQNQEPIDMFLQTPGGEFKHAMAIEQVMRTLQSKVNTHALSECNSGGAVLLAAGTGKRQAYRGALVVLHGIVIHGRPPPGMKEGIQDTYTQFWRDHTHLPEKWLPMPNGVLHVLSAEQALEYGIVDEIVEK